MNQDAPSVNQYLFYECPHCGYRITLRSKQAIEEFNIPGFDLCPGCKAPGEDRVPRVVKERYVPGQLPTYQES